MQYRVKLIFDQKYNSGPKTRLICRRHYPVFPHYLHKSAYRSIGLKQLSRSLLYFYPYLMQRYFSLARTIVRTQSKVRHYTTEHVKNASILKARGTYAELQYAVDHSTPIPQQSIWDDLVKETEKLDNAHMMAPKAQGLLLNQLVGMLGARNLLEIGTFTGSSTLALASAVSDSGSLVSLDMDPTVQGMAADAINKAGLKADLRLGNALESLGKLSQERRQFDFVFIDANKSDYANYLDCILDNNMLAERGVIVVDNVLFWGQVHRTAGYESYDPNTTSKRILKASKAIHAFNEKVRNDPRLQVVVLPAFDGISIIRRK
ncbi:O-methyltransferase-domain-containing protein [Syncephalastrum racemosum]|uniref:O-methyltransferase-domain-containing protein n=1 Tax=Syncephalastrum racemosum TaxID=13706 RepID=A0A1X2H796_SYNRA|nr:O-methyltransferase-domain-containing protein [Syncephalastrum racemosum]